MLMITSPANERLKHARRVRDGREPEWIFIEGERLVEECLQVPLPLVACFHEPEPSARTQAILTELRRRECPLFPTTAAVLATLSDTVTPQGVVVLAQRPTTGLAQMLMAAHPLIVALDAVQDPGNFGTIARTAEAAGASGVVALKGSVDAFAPKTLRSAMGSAFRLPIVSGLTNNALLVQARAAGLKVLATAATAAIRYDQFDWQQSALVVFGNEARGVNQSLLEACDTQISIPLQAPVESLNVAAAAAAILFEAARQRRTT
jgi:TrmH family RNA methyltransferase